MEFYEIRYLKLCKVYSTTKHNQNLEIINPIGKTLNHNLMHSKGEATNPI